MLKRTGYRVLATLVCTIVFVAVAGGHEGRISPLANIGNAPELQAGTYRVSVVKNQDSAEVGFYQEGDVLATAPAALAREATKRNSTEVHSQKVHGECVIIKICVQGSNESLVFKLEIPRLC
jgi:hypothetical protein